MKHELETMREIWPDNGDGECIEVGPDRDGLGCVEIRFRNKDGKIDNRITLPIEAARLVSFAVSSCAGEIEDKNRKA